MAPGGGARAGANDQFRRDERARRAGSPVSIVRSSSRRLRLPISLKSWRTVVSGGRKYGASGMSSKPTTLSVARDRAAGLVHRAQEAERHLVVGHEHRGDGRLAAEAPAEVVAGARAPVSDQRLGHLGAGRVAASYASPGGAGRTR